MARAWITDLWVKDAHALMPDGAKVRISPSAAELKNLRTLPEHFRTARYGKGSRWRVGWYEPDGGERGRLYGSKADAEAYLAELEDNIRMGKYAPPEKTEQRFKELADTWMKSKRRPKAVSIDAYRTDLAVHILPKWAETPINRISREAIDAWIDDLVTGTAPRTYTGRSEGREIKGLAPSRVRDIVGRTFTSVLRYAHDEGWMPRNPMRHVELPRVAPASELAILDYVEVERLAAACAKVSGEHRDRALIHVLASSGPRIGEATAFQVRDVQPLARRATVQRTWTTEGGRRVIGPPKTWETRSIPVHGYALEELTPLMEDEPGEQWLFRVKRGGGAVDQRNWRRNVWVPALRLAGLEDERDLTPHKLRHTAASAAIAAGADPLVVQKMLGHKTPKETMRTYAHLWHDRLDEVIDAVSEHREKALAKATETAGLLEAA
ncbi:site-specific integrase [Leucobacter allii]|uniref:Site-specific integrase n=1 Tax=Leucobacter allii TaxID=2932247 RepID=A0ABY4FPC4_9MICO|nr:site-specific integrase [Leucobacter allii]UOQ58136.1 site-specific integrase [Leucobacter allii]